MLEVTFLATLGNHRDSREVIHIPKKYWNFYSIGDALQHAIATRFKTDLDHDKWQEWTSEEWERFGEQMKGPMVSVRSKAGEAVVSNTTASIYEIDNRGGRIVFHWLEDGLYCHRGDVVEVTLAIPTQNEGEG